jgi:transcriptional regulator with XRE-family HTH domain
LSIAENVRNTRFDRRLTQTEVARRCGVTPAAISGLEHGEFNPSTPLLVKLAKALDVPIDELVEEAAPLAEAPPETGLADWRANVATAHEMREAGLPYMEEVLLRWHTSTAQGESYEVRRIHLDNMGEVLQEAYNVARLLTETFFHNWTLSLDWEEARAADLFYWDLVGMIEGEEGLSVRREKQTSSVDQALEQHRVEEVELAGREDA